MDSPIWIPSEDRIASSNMTTFMRYVEKLTGQTINTYEKLYNWSISEPDEFWKSIWVIAGIIRSAEYKNIRTGSDMMDTKWFDGAMLNFAENLLKYRDNRIAIISTRENSKDLKITYNELYELVAKCAEGLKRIGVKKGDRVAAYISNIPEAIIGMLAATSMGALWSSSSPDFGLQGILDRFGQIQPKVLFAMDSYQYNGKVIDCSEKIEQITGKIPEIEKVIIIPGDNNFIGTDNSLEMKYGKSPKYILFNKLIDNNSTNVSYEQLPFDYPVYIMYSSGTTGKPKCIVHGAGGTLLQHFKELSLHTNLKRHDIITYYTTCGWMMWNWLISSLQTGATIFLYDGSPVYPDINTLWKNIDKYGITIFGTSPKFLSICEKSGLLPKNDFNLDRLKTILSTGSPLSAENFRYVYNNVKDDVQLSSISGGTDIISCFALGNPNLPVYEGELQCRGLGMKVEAFNDEGHSVIDEKGELVCTAPFPSMPVFFWDDPEKVKYKAAYFEYFPGIWRHGDFIKITKRGSVVIYGRSDATLNPGGIRIGTAEIYRIVEKMDEISDSIVVGQQWKNDIRIILFVVLKDGIGLTEELADLIKLKIKTLATSRHVPARIFQVSDVPRTLSGKKVELAVSKIIKGEEIINIEALANPESLKQYGSFANILSS